jgi:predicted dehydrogenase
MSRFRVALVGLGGAGLTLHIPALAGLPGAQLVGACDIAAAQRARAAARCPAPLFEDFDEMVRAVAPDVVIVATPPDSHAEYCLRSLAAGAHVVCEKPFVSDVDAADRVIAAAATAGRRVALNHEFREMPIFRALLTAVTPSELVFAQVWQLMDLPPWAEPGWRGRMPQRTMYEAGVHLVDFLTALFGEQPRSVWASTSTCGVRADDTDAVALVTLEFSRGRLAQIVQNRLCKGETQYFEVRAETGGASYRASFGGRARVSAGLHRALRPHLRVEYGIAGIAWREVGNRRHLLARNPRDPGMIATRHVLGRSLAAFRDGTELPTGASAARDVLRVIAAAYRSAATGQRVSLDAGAGDGPGALRMGAAMGAAPAAVAR